MLNFYLIIGCALVATRVITAFPFGAPSIACGTMMPLHVPFLYSLPNSPFLLDVSSTTASANTPITVTLKTNGSPFRGYIIQARSGKSNQPIGTFVVAGQSNTGQLMNCPGGTANSVTHTNKMAKTEQKFQWSPPNGFTGKVTLRATVVQKYDKIYKNILSNEITVVS